MEEVVGFVYAHHVVKDEDDKTYGMTYEFYDVKQDRKVQAFGLDSMHDGGWFAAAMATAERIYPKGRFLERALKYQVPFYANMINHSDRLFPDKQRREGQDNKPLEEPLKGWVPRGWDTGNGYDLQGKRFEKEAYGTPSNHLAQDLSDMLLNVWMSTHSERVAQAAVNIDNYRTEYFRAIHVVRYAADYARGQAEPKAVSTEWEIPEKGPYAGLYLQKGAPSAPGGDGAAWSFREDVADAALRGTFSPGRAWQQAARVLYKIAALEFFYDDGPIQYGMFPGGDHGAGAPPSFTPGTGKLSFYHSERKAHIDARGLTDLWPSAGVLPVLRQHSELWEMPYREQHGDEPLVRIVDDAPVTDGKRDETYGLSQSLATEDTTLTLLGDPRNMHVLIESHRPRVDLTIKHDAEVEGETFAGVIGADGTGSFGVRNNKGAPLLHETGFVRKQTRWVAEFRIPYTAVREQAHWINGVDHGRYAVTLNGGKPTTVYMLSSTERVIRKLEDHALGSVQNWHQVWQERGYIPWTLRKGLADAGHVAHIVHMISYILMDRAGTAEWDLIRKQTPTAPLNIELPETVLKAQGLKQ
jgi:hypothetical protein